MLFNFYILKNSNVALFLMITSLLFVPGDQLAPVTGMAYYLKKKKKIKCSLILKITPLFIRGVLFVQTHLHRVYTNAHTWRWTPHMGSACGVHLPMRAPVQTLCKGVCGALFLFINCIQNSFLKQKIAPHLRQLGGEFFYLLRVLLNRQGPSRTQN